MKKILVLLLLLLIYFSLPLKVVLGENASSAAAPVSQEQKVDYALPYPGILPDNPLYFLKTLRDKIIKFLITDPLKKADFALLTSDKRLNAASYLFKKDKQKMAIDTLSKSTNYFSESLDRIKEAQGVGKDTGDISGRISLAFAKHAEVLKDLAVSVSVDLKPLFDSEQARLISLENAVKALSAK